jgi:hypothetical protein
MLVMAQPYLHPGKKVLSIERAIPRTQTRNKQPNCGFAGCSSPAEFAIQIGDENGSSYVDRCAIHLAQELQDPLFSSKVLSGLINLFLPKV